MRPSDRCNDRIVLWVFSIAAATTESASSSISHSPDVILHFSSVVFVRTRISSENFVAKPITATSLSSGLRTTIIPGCRKGSAAILFNRSCTIPRGVIDAEEVVSQHSSRPGGRRLRSGYCPVAAENIQRPRMSSSPTCVIYWLCTWTCLYVLWFQLHFQQPYRGSFPSQATGRSGELAPQWVDPVTLIRVSESGT